MYALPFVRLECMRLGGERVGAVLGMLLGVVMGLIVVLGYSVSNYLDAKTEELRARARKERQDDEERRTSA